MTGAQSARNVLLWIDIGESHADDARKACRGRKDIERLRVEARSRFADELSVSLVATAARQRDLSFLAMYLATGDIPNALLVHEGGWALPMLESVEAAV